MFLTSASLLLSFSWVFWTWAYAAHRRPVPLAWTQTGAASTAVVLALVSLFAMGVGAAAAAAIAPLDALREQTVLSAAATAAAPVLAVLATPYLRRPLAAPRAPDTAAGAATL